MIGVVVYFEPALREFRLRVVYVRSKQAVGCLATTMEETTTIIVAARTSAAGGGFDPTGGGLPATAPSQESPEQVLDLTALWACAFVVVRLGWGSEADRRRS